MRLHAAKGLTYLGNQGLAELRTLLNDDDHAVRNCAAEALIGCGLPPETIISALATDNPWDVEAGKLMRQLKVFYLVGCAYKAGYGSMRAANKYLKNTMIAHHSEKDDLAVTNVGFDSNIVDLTPLFCGILGKDKVTLLIKTKIQSQHLPVQFSDDAWRAWEWTDGFLRRHLPPDWYGFALAHENKPQSAS